MKDIDFDELDRAVSSLMAKVPPQPESPKKDDVVLSLDETLPESTPATQYPAEDTSATEPAPQADFIKAPTLPSDDEIHTEATLSVDISQTETEPSYEETVVESVTSEAPDAAEPEVQALSVAAKRGGRFMDVVHPSSDMTQLQPPTRQPSRRGATLTPLTNKPVVNDIISTPPTPVVASSIAAPTVDPTVDGSLEETTPEETESYESDVQDQPNIEASAAAFDSAPEPVQTANEPTDSALATLPEDILLQDEPAPQAESETAVETPNGDDVIEPATDDQQAFADELAAAVKSDNTEAFSPFLSNVSPEKRPLGGGEASVLPAADTVPEEERAGADSNDNESSATEEKPVILPEELSSDVLEVESTHAQFGAPSVPSKVSRDDSSAPVSIAQQYKLQPLSKKLHHEHEALYDSATISPAIQHAGRKKSGWLPVLVIFGLVVLGAGGAAALYFLNII